ncbi:MAG: hypothetical protein A4E40_00210 [Methanoregulaceae archaeon PtaU1.Bin059]|nr:MAG: hypothetical protein A4E40_00210 [Methanoregulaceae archaeon PtaU1.Bin059]
MEAIQYRRIRIVKFFLVPPRKRIFPEIKDLFYDYTTGFVREPYKIVMCSPLNKNCKHAFRSPVLSIFLQYLVRVKCYIFAGPVNLGDHFPVSPILLVLDHPCKKIIITLAGFFQFVQIPPGRLFHGNAFDFTIDSTHTGRHTYT